MYSSEFQIIFIKFMYKYHIEVFHFKGFHPLNLNVFQYCIVFGSESFHKSGYERNECKPLIIEYTCVKYIIHDVDGQQNS